MVSRGLLIIERVHTLTVELAAVFKAEAVRSNDMLEFTRVKGNRKNRERHLSGIKQKTFVIAATGRDIRLAM